MDRQRIVVALAGCIGAAAASACTIVTEGFVDPAADEYVLYGEVTGYASVHIGTCDDESVRDQCQQSWGLQLEIHEPQQLPNASVRSIELYSFGLDSLCGREPVTEARVRAIPIGAKFKIAAKPLEDMRQDDRALALDGSDWRSAAVVRLPPDVDLREVARSRFDYGYRGQPPHGDDRDFELRKDILRLERSRSQRESVEILKRLAAQRPLRLSSLPDEDDAFDSLVKRYLHDTRSIDLVRRYRAAYQGPFEDFDSAGPTWLALHGDPYWQSLRALELMNKGFVPEGLEQLESASRAGYLPAKLQLARSAATLADTLAQLDAELAASYAARSRVAFNEALAQARRGMDSGDPIALFVLASLYRRHEAGLPLDVARADRLDCLAMLSAGPDLLPAPRGDEDARTRERLDCRAVLQESTGALPPG